MNALASKYLDLLRQCEASSSSDEITNTTDTSDGASKFAKTDEDEDDVDINETSENTDVEEKGEQRWKTVNTLRRLVLLEGMPAGANDLDSEEFGRCSLRGLVWKALLGIGTVDVQEYTDIVRKGPSADDSRVREDTKRTFPKNYDFVRKVPNEKLVRVLNAYVHSAGNVRGVYTQSMSLLLAPFLYVMPEPDAFHCFRVYLRVKIPEYVRKYTGAKRGCELLDACLRSTNRSLYDLFRSSGLNAEVYAFPNISSLGACVPPIDDTIRLWDIQLAFGVHMHVLFTLSRLLLASERILKASENASGAPMITRELERGLGVDADTVLAKAIPLVPQLDPDLYRQLTIHAISSSREAHSEGEAEIDSGLSSLVVGKEATATPDCAQDDQNDISIPTPKQPSKNSKTNEQLKESMPPCNEEVSDVVDSSSADLTNTSKTSPKLSGNSIFPDDL